MELKFLDSTVTINTADEYLLFVWMLYDRDVVEFKIGGVHVTADWGNSSVDIMVIDGSHKYTRHIEDPRGFCIETSKNPGLDSLNYDEYGEYSYISSKGYLVVAQGDSKIRMKIDGSGTAKDISYSTTHNNTDVEYIGVDESKRVQYNIKFHSPGEFKFFYDVRDPLDSYFKRI